MQYKTTVLIEGEFARKLRTGEARLQRGQWVILSGSIYRSRWVGVDGGSLCIAHWQGTGRRTLERFKSLCEIPTCLA